MIAAGAKSGPQRQRGAIGEDGVLQLPGVAPFGAQIEPRGVRLAASGALQRDPVAVEVDDLAVAFVGADRIDHGQQITKGDGRQALQRMGVGLRFGLGHARRASSRVKNAIEGHRGKYSVNGARGGWFFGIATGAFRPERSVDEFRRTVPRATGMDYRTADRSRSPTHDLSRRRRPAHRPGRGAVSRACSRVRAFCACPARTTARRALQAKAAGFDALYLSGAAMTASMGIPDLGMITVDEVCFFVRQIARATGLPLLVDGDTGYGEALNVMNMVRCFEDAGAAAVHIEDQLLPKKCGHLNDKKLADPHDMAAKIAAARKARKHLFIVARTDAAASEGIDGSVGRAKLFMEAGADAIFPEALVTADMFREVALRLPGVPLLANMTEFGRTPFFTGAEFEEMGYKMVIWPVSSFGSPTRRRRSFIASLAKHDGTHKMVDRMQTRAELTRPSATMITRRWTRRS